MDGSDLPPSSLPTTSLTQGKNDFLELRNAAPTQANMASLTGYYRLDLRDIFSACAKLSIDQQHRKSRWRCHRRAVAESQL